MVRVGLTARIVVDQAVDMADTLGLRELTLARIAQTVGVATPSLYKHVGGIDDLISRMATLVTSDFATQLSESTRGLAGYQALVALANAFRDIAHHHPGTYTLTQQHRPSKEWEEAAAEVLKAFVAALTGYGIGVNDVDKIRFLRSTLHGFVDLEHRGGFGRADSIEHSFDTAVAALDSVLVVWAAMSENNKDKDPKNTPGGPSVKDGEVYEALRKGGASKEKAARIANASANSSRTAVGKKGGEAGSYDDWTVEELRKRAAEVEIEGRSTMNKAELIMALRNH